MTGLIRLDQILEQLQPRLEPHDYVYCSVADPTPELLSGAAPFAVIHEREGTTMVLRASRADALGLHDGRVFRRISLGVHSSLEAVGLTAVASRALADAGISANVIAGYFHDHFMVPEMQAQLALEILQNLPAAGSED